MTKSEAVKKLCIDLDTFDYAIPERFNDEIRNFIDNPPAHFVWSYRSSIFGYPRPLTKAGQQALIMYNQKYGTVYKTDDPVIDPVID